MRISFLFFLLLFCNLPAKTFSQSARPKIGLTLSGGGAKGLAHIGLLKAIDSVGLKVDYITGTSMGAVVGAMYAIGYSGAEIETIARNIDWDVLLSNQVAMRNLTLEEKEDYGRYPLEFAFKEGRPRLPAGLLAGQELWLKLAEIYFPAHNQTDFSKFPIPFKCIATDIVRGEGVVLDSGSLVMAVRASMAIPTIFTSVNINDRLLVDGSVIRNFPVEDVRKMGADFVIGSTVSGGLASKDQLNSLLDVMFQLAFLKESEDYRKQVPLCNIFIQQPIDNYSTGSFGQANAIIDSGIAEGNRRYAQLARLADSLHSYRNQPPLASEMPLPREDSIYITDFEVKGFTNTTLPEFKVATGFESGRYYTDSALNATVRRAAGSRSYQSIYYRLVPTAGGQKVIFELIESPTSHTQLGLHYNSFAGISLLLNLTGRNFLFPNSKSSVTLNIGENMRARAEHVQYYSYIKNVALISKAQFESFKINTFTDLARSGQYRQVYFLGESKAMYTGSRDINYGIGGRYEHLNFKPLVQTSEDIRGKSGFFSLFGLVQVNTVDDFNYPASGMRMRLEGAQVFGQNPRFSYESFGTPVPAADSSTYADKRGYQRAVFHLETYKTIKPKLVFQTMLQSGINFNSKQNLVNNFQLGGLTRTIRNQILFAGADEVTISTPSIVALSLGLRYNFAKDFYALVRTNGALYDFFNDSKRLDLKHAISGHALTLAYNSTIGPIELSVSYRDQDSKVLTYLNIGVPFY
jgi:NTE family protein